LFDFGWRDAHAGADTIALAKRRLRFAALFQMTFPGAPAVFYGDEVGVTGGEDPYNRVTYPWADRGGKPDLALLDAYKRLIRLRRDLPVLRHGSIDAPLYLDAHTIVLLRRDGALWALTAFNNDTAPHSVRVALPPDVRDATFVDALASGASRAHDGVLTLDVGALDGRVLKTTTAR
jgi:glycosidase